METNELTKDTEFIENCCEYAEGFQVLNQEHEVRIQIPTRDQIGFDELDGDYWMKSVIYPLLLQRSIEGVNRAFLKYAIHQSHNNIRCINTSTEEHELICAGISEETKKAVLEYVFNNQKK